MRGTQALAAVALVAAFAGGAASLGIAKAAGWLNGSERTVVVRESAEPPAPPSPAPAPLPGARFDAASIYAQRAAGVVTVYAFFAERRAASQGTGFVVSGDGVILTNSHVITDAGDAEGPVRAAQRVFVEFADGDRVQAKVVGWDVFDDVGVLRVDRRLHRLRPLPLSDSSLVRVGQPVAVIGSPFGNESSLAVGVVSATRSIASLTSRYNLADAIQIDAPINHGNSGGPLFDGRGQVIGITAQIRSETGVAEGVGFAVPINAARRSLEQLLATGRVAYAYVGISTEDLTPSIARRFGFPVSWGAVITSVRPGTAGASAGLRGGRQDAEYGGTVITLGGDVVTAVGGRPIRSAEDVVRVVTANRPGDAVVFSVLRGRQRLDLRVVLGTRPENPDSGR